jgi:hypothetical protein
VPIDRGVSRHYGVQVVQQRDVNYPLVQVGFYHLDLEDHDVFSACQLVVILGRLDKLIRMDEKGSVGLVEELLNCRSDRARIDVGERLFRVSDRSAPRDFCVIT